MSPWTLLLTTVCGALVAFLGFLTATVGFLSAVVRLIRHTSELDEAIENRPEKEKKDEQQETDEE